MCRDSYQKKEEKKKQCAERLVSIYPRSIKEFFIGSMINALSYIRQVKR